MQLEVQLQSLDGPLAAYALDELSQERSEDDAVAMVPEELFESTQWFANVSFALDQLAQRDHTRSSRPKRRAQGGTMRRLAPTHPADHRRAGR